MRVAYLVFHESIVLILGRILDNILILSTWPNLVNKLYIFYRRRRDLQINTLLFFSSFARIVSWNKNLDLVDINPSNRSW